MSGTNKNSTLHLPNLEISGFRGINSLSISRLGHVTLLAGLNSVGKTTVLEAIKLYAARGRQSAIQELLVNRDEFEYSRENQSDPPMRMFEYANLFYGRNIDESSKIFVGSGKKMDSMYIEACSWREGSDQFQKTAVYQHDHQFDNTIIVENTDLEFLKIIFQGKKLIMPRASINMLSPIIGRAYAHDEHRWASAMKCVFLGPAPPKDDEVVGYWENVALTDDDKFCLESLRLVMVEDNYVEGVATIGDKVHSRRVIAKLKGNSKRVPLASLGDGAMRIFGVALSLANSRDGFLLIDEAGNGIHHSRQEDYWHMILESALKGNIQVVATTHSWDCVRGFARAAAKSKAEGILVRLQQREQKHMAVEFTEDELEVAVEQRIEIR